MSEALLFCHICGGIIEIYDERAEWDGRLAHALCVEQQDDALDPEDMENLGYVE